MVARAAHRSFEYMSGTQYLAYFANISIQPAKREGRSARDDTQCRDLREPVRELFSQAIAERLVALVIAKVDQRQHDDGLAIVRVRYQHPHRLPGQPDNHAP